METFLRYLERALFVVLERVINRFYASSTGVFFETYTLWKDRKELLNGVPPIHWDMLPYDWESLRTEPGSMNPTPPVVSRSKIAYLNDLRDRLLRSRKIPE